MTGDRTSPAAGAADLQPRAGDPLPCVVVGAGPVGLSAALALRARDVPVTLLEAEPRERTRPGSRAIFTHRASLELLDRMRPGLAGSIREDGIIWSTKRTFWRGREVFSRTYPPLPPGSLPPFISLPQTEVERHLYAACVEAGVEFRWGAEVHEVASGEEGVRLGLVRGADLHARYVIAADGARSAVRTSLGIAMEGSRSENAFIIVDVAEVPEAPLPVERIFHYEHPVVDGRNVLLVPFAGGWRVDLQCFPDDDPEEFGGEEGAARWLGKVLPERYVDRITWVSTYRFLQVVARSLVDEFRRVLLVGEAAHLFAPFGARGMNSGIADADEAAEAVAGAVDTTDASVAGKLVEGFHRRRHEAALYNRDAAGVALTHMQAREPGIRLKRRLAVLLASVSTRAGQWLDRAPYGPRTGPPTAGAGRY